MILIKRIKRVVGHWLDAEFDGDEYADRLFYSDDEPGLSDSDYYIAQSKIVNNKNYFLICNVDDETDIFFREVSIDDGHTSISGLENDEEFDAVWTAFFGAIPNDTPAGESDILNSIKAAVKEGDRDE